MAFTVTLYDGVTTLNLVDGTNYKVLEGQLDIGVSGKVQAWGGEQSLFRDGARLKGSAFENRTITIPLVIIGSTKSALRTNIRAISAMLDRAREREILGFGTGVTLALDEGASASITFDVLDGELRLPTSYFGVHVDKLSATLGATLRLTCKPFGRVAEVTPDAIVIENEDDGTNHPYGDWQSLATDTWGRTKIKIVPTGATGSATVWVARRSGSRRTDDLWTEGEDADSYTDFDLDGGHGSTAQSDIVHASCSGATSKYNDVRITVIDATNIPVGIVGYHTFNLGAAPPKGHFRVLARCSALSVNDIVAATTHFQFGLGYNFGSLTVTPATANYVLCAPGSGAATLAWHILDLGDIYIPPQGVPDGQTLSAFNLYIYMRLNTEIGGVEAAMWWAWCLDYLFLIPIDEGYCVINAVAAAERVLIDTQTDPPGFYILDSSDNVLRVPDFVGAPFPVGQEDTRVYVLRDDAITVTHSVTANYIPQRLNL